MTSEEYDKLSEEEQRVKVAELCGRKCTCTETTYGCCKVHDPLDCPDYLNDLNAMQKVWEEMDYKHKGIFMEFLETICRDFGYAYTEDIIGATAAQRAKAYVLTMTMEEE